MDNHIDNGMDNHIDDPNGSSMSIDFSPGNAMQGNAMQCNTNNNNVCVSENSGNSTMNSAGAPNNHTHKMGKNLIPDGDMAKARADIVAQLFWNDKNYVSITVLNGMIEEYAKSITHEEWLDFSQFLARKRANCRGGLKPALFGQYFKTWQEEQQPKEPKNRRPHNRRENIPQIAKELANGRKPLELVYDDSRHDFEASGAMTDYAPEEYGRGEVSQL